MWEQISRSDYQGGSAPTPSGMDDGRECHCTSILHTNSATIKVIKSCSVDKLNINRSYMYAPG